MSAKSIIGEMMIIFNDKRNLIFSFIIILLLFITMCWNVYCYLGYKGIVNKVEDRRFSEVMGRDKDYYRGPDEGRFFSGLFQEHLEKATSDHFPLFAIFKYREVERWFAKINLGILPSSWTPLLPIGGNLLLFKQKNLLVDKQEPYSQNKDQILSTRSNYYNNFIKENPSINLFVFPVLDKKDWLVMSSEYLKVSPKIFIGDKYVDSFRVLLDPAIGYSWGGGGTFHLKRC